LNYNNPNINALNKEAAMSVGFQGEHGAYSEEACFGLFNSPETKPCETFEAVFAAVSSADCEIGLIPIENTLAGSIHQNYDLLLQYELHVVAEYFLRVRHCLIAFPGVKKTEITKVISHPQALGQCAGYLRDLGVKTMPVYDTAGSVKLMIASEDHATAAIASRKAAEIYGMEILQEGIEDDPANYTRFLAISRTPVIPSGDAKTSIVFILKNQPGALFKALSVFALREIDLTKIESRPLVGKPWEYLFYIDFAGAVHEGQVQKALDHLAEYALMLRVFGSYDRANII
jgi:prephenate dehydratase